MIMFCLSLGLSLVLEKGVEDDRFSSFLRVFGSFSTLLRLFLVKSFFDPGAERPQEPLFFQIFFLGVLFSRETLGRGLFDSCRRPTMSQSKALT